jgi:hypothetical protein
MQSDKRITVAAVLFVLAVGTGIALLLPRAIGYMKAEFILNALETAKNDAYRAPSDLRDRLLRGFRPIAGTMEAPEAEKADVEQTNFDRILSNRSRFLQCGDQGRCTGGLVKEKGGQVLQVDECFSCISSFDLYRAAMTLDLKVLDRFDWIILRDSILWVSMAVQYQQHRI